MKKFQTKFIHNCNNCGRAHSHCSFVNVAQFVRLEQQQDCPMWIPAVAMTRFASEVKRKTEAWSLLK